MASVTGFGTTETEEINCKERKRAFVNSYAISATVAANKRTPGRL